MGHLPSPLLSVPLRIFAPSRGMLGYAALELDVLRVHNDAFILMPNGFTGLRLVSMTLRSPSYRDRIRQHVQTSQYSVAGTASGGLRLRAGVAVQRAPYRD